MNPPWPDSRPRGRKGSRKFAPSKAQVRLAQAVGTCSTNSRIDDINRRVDGRFEDMNRRIDDGFENVNRRIDELQVDVRELRTLVFETLKGEQSPAN